MPEKLEPSVLHELLGYDIFTGVLTWKFRESRWFKTENDCKRWNARFAGKTAFNHLDADGYAKGSIFGVYYRAHRVIWCYCFGYWPDEVDHENGIRNDNRLVNLFETSDIGNSRNRKMPNTNKSGIIGVYFYSRNQKWIAQISENNKNKSLGYFVTLEDAVKARQDAEIKLGYHRNHGAR